MNEKKEIVFNEFEKEIKHTGDFFQEEIGRRFKGLFGVVVKRVARELFNWIISAGALDRGRRNFKYVLDVAEIVDGDIKRTVDKMIEGYLKTNELYIRADKAHPSFNKLKSLLKEEFEARLKIYNPILKSDGNDYGELVRGAFTHKKDILHLTEKYFDVIDRIVKCMDEEKGLIRIPSAIRNPIIKIIKISFDSMKEKILNDIDLIYERRKKT